MLFHADYANSHLSHSVCLPLAFILDSQVLSIHIHINHIEGQGHFPVSKALTFPWNFKNNSILCSLSYLLPYLSYHSLNKAKHLARWSSSFALAYREIKCYIHVKATLGNKTCLNYLISITINMEYLWLGNIIKKRDWLVNMKFKDRRLC